MPRTFLETRIKTETGEFDIEAGYRWVGDDLLVAIWGGEKPHIGAVAVARSRPSLKDPNARSATASVICFPSHKEDEMAKSVAEILAAVLDTSVVVTAGIHWDNLSQEGIQKIIRNGNTLVDLILDEIHQKK
jgi:hypothetical protein